MNDPVTCCARSTPEYFNLYAHFYQPTTDVMPHYGIERTARIDDLFIKKKNLRKKEKPKKKNTYILRW